MLVQVVTRSRTRLLLGRENGGFSPPSEDDWETFLPSGSLDLLAGPVVARGGLVAG